MKEASPKTLGLIILAVGCLGIGLGFFQLSRSLNNPFAEVVESLSDTTNARREIMALREKDTDHDTLTDFDELKIYHTSPYLADSDSDNISDNIELAGGTNPNCPEGKTCRISAPDTNATTDLANLYNINQNVNTTPGSNANLPANSNVILNNGAGTNPAPDAVSMSALRDTLAGAGVPAETLNAMTDDELRQLYAEALSEETKNSNINTAVTNQANSSNLNEIDQQTLAQLSQLTPAEIRELMISSGVPTDTLSQIDDATLKAIFDESLRNINQ